MKHLSGLDAAFLHIESPEMPMHVGSLNVLRLPEGYQGDFYEDVKAHMAARLHLAEVFTRKLVLMPFDISDPVGRPRRQYRRVAERIRDLVTAGLAPG